MGFADYVPAFSTPQMAIIKDKRLGALVAFLYFAVVVAILAATISTKAYQMSLDPSGIFYSYWADHGHMPTVQSLFNQGNMPTHCKKYEKYNYFDGLWATWNYKCVALSLSEMHEKGENEFFIMTHFDDTHVETGPCDKIQDCSYEEDGPLDPRNWDWFHNDLGDGICECGKKQSYLTVGAEHMDFSMTHRMFANHNGKTAFMGGSSGNVTTIIYNPNGEDLVYDGQQRAISLPITTWLELAGVDLDSTKTLP